MKRRRTRHTNGLNFYEETTTINFPLIREIVLWVIYTVLAVFLAVVWVRYLGFRMQMRSGAMEPAILSQQQVLVSRLSYRMSTPEIGDIVAFYPGGNTKMYPSIRRIAALPGSTVEIRDGIFLINGTPAPGIEAYDPIPDPGMAAQVITLGENEYFVLSDDRADTEDSRSASIGTVKTDDIIGEVWLSLPQKGGGLHFGVIRSRTGR